MRRLFPFWCKVFGHRLELRSAEYDKHNPELSDELSLCVCGEWWDGYYSGIWWFRWL